MMAALREALKESSPELYQAYMRSWDIAWNEWLPALAVQNDSYNSYPHIRNLETYLDQVLFDNPGSCGKATGVLRVNLTPVEIYLLLCSVLFHDIGRIHAKDGHGKKSSDLVKKHWSGFGIRSYELAGSLGNICHYHDCGDEEREELHYRLCNVVIDPYGEVRERPIASLLLLADHLDGAFTRVLPHYLRSSDNIQVIGAFRRVVRGVYIDHFCQMVRTVLSDDLPRNPRDKDHMEICSRLEYTVNKKRKPDRAEYYENELLEKLQKGRKEFANYLPERNEELKRLKKEAENIKGKLTKSEFEEFLMETGSGFSSSFIQGILNYYQSLNQYYYVEDLPQKFKSKLKDLCRITEFLNQSGSMFPRSVSLKDFSEAFDGLFKLFYKNGSNNIAYEQLLENAFRDNGPGSEDFPISFRNGLTKNRIFLHNRVYKDNVQFSTAEWLIARQRVFASKLDEMKGWPEKTLLAMVMGNVRENSEALKIIQDDLMAMGIPVKGWLIDHEEHLYNEYGEETFEPIFNKDFLKRVVDSMWKLSTQVFGTSYFSYESLTADVREVDAKKVKAAVRRIGIITRCSEYFSNDGKHPCAIWWGDNNWKWVIEKKDGKCVFTVKSEIQERIDRLGAPV